MKLKNIALVLCLSIALAACNKRDIMLFDIEDSGIYFQQGGQTRFYLNIDAYYDSLYFSFSVAPLATVDTVLTARIRTLGKVYDYPRPVKLSVDRERTTAIEGKHYDIDLNAAVIPAGESEIRFPVTFHRTPDVLENRFSLVLKLEENEHFKVYMVKQKDTNVYTSVGEQIDADRFTFTVSEIYTPPSYWNIFGLPYFGEWSVAKYKFVNVTMDWTVEDWEKAGSGKILLGRFGVAALTVRNALQELADNNTPLIDDNGSYVQLGPNYLVDYSAYIE